MGMVVKITNNSGLAIEEMKAAVERGMNASGLHLQGEAAEELENVPRRVDTGRLKGSIGSTVEGDTVTVGTNVEYGIYVHEGTYKMAPNRFLKNAFERNIDQVKEYLENALKG